MINLINVICGDEFFIKSATFSQPAGDLRCKRQNSQKECGDNSLKCSIDFLSSSKGTQGFFGFINDGEEDSESIAEMVKEKIRKQKILTVNGFEAIVYYKKGYTIKLFKTNPKYYKFIDRRHFIKTESMSEYVMAANCPDFVKYDKWEVVE